MISETTLSSVIVKHSDKTGDSKEKEHGRNEANDNKW